MTALRKIADYSKLCIKRSQMKLSYKKCTGILQSWLGNNKEGEKLLQMCTDSRKKQTPLKLKASGL